MHKGSQRQQTATEKWAGCKGGVEREREEWDRGAACGKYKSTSFKINNFEMARYFAHLQKHTYNAHI